MSRLQVNLRGSSTHAAGQPCLITRILLLGGESKKIYDLPDVRNQIAS